MSYSGLLANLGLLVPLGQPAALELGVTGLYAGADAFDFDGRGNGLVLGAYGGLALFVF